jgi:hypothetical protein
MLFSVFDDIGGDFILYEYEDKIPINNDRPVPDLPSREIGVPSVEAARALPNAAVRVGQSDRPVGVIAMRRKGTVKEAATSALDPSLGGLGEVLSTPPGPALAALTFLVCVALGYGIVVGVERLG